MGYTRHNTIVVTAADYAMEGRFGGDEPGAEYESALIVKVNPHVKTGDVTR